MRPYKGKHGMDAKQLCIVVVMSLIAMAFLAITVSSHEYGFPAGEQVKTMLTVTLE